MPEKYEVISALISANPKAKRDESTLISALEGVRQHDNDGS